MMFFSVWPREHAFWSHKREADGRKSDWQSEDLREGQAWHDYIISYHFGWKHLEPIECMLWRHVGTMEEWYVFLPCYGFCYIVSGYKLISLDESAYVLSLHYYFCFYYANSRLYDYICGMGQHSVTDRFLYIHTCRHIFFQAFAFGLTWYLAP